MASITIAMAREFSDILGHRIGGLKRVNDRNVYDKILFFRRRERFTARAHAAALSKLKNATDVLLSSSLSVAFALALG